MDVVETDTTIHIMTERVKPLSAALPTWSAKGAQEKEDWLLWGLHRISVSKAIVSVHTAVFYIAPKGSTRLCE